MGVTEKLADFVVGRSFADLPKEAVGRAKELILDAVGTAILGSGTPVSKIIANYSKETGCAPEATVVGGGFKTSVTWASLNNATSSHSTELEADSIKGGPVPLHTIFASLAVGEKFGLSGQAVLEGFILGFELQGRIYDATPGMSKRGFLGANVCGCLGAAAVAAKMLKLDAHQIRTALGIAASQAGSIRQQVGTLTHFIEFGIYSRNGVESALLAKAGITALTDVIENPLGLCHLFAGEGNYDLEEMTKGIGDPFQIVSPGVHIKKYPCCFRTHRAVDVVLELMSEYNSSYEDVAAVEVDVNQYDFSILRYPEPKSGEEARFSMPHCVGAALLEGKVEPKTFTDECVAAPKFMEARSKVKVILHPEWPPERGSSHTPVTIRLRDGRAYSREFDEPRNLAGDELTARYRTCAESVLGREEIERSIALIVDLEHVKKAGELMSLVRGEARV